MAMRLNRKLSTLEAARLASPAINVEDLHRLAIALAEVAAEEAIRSRPFADRVRLLYEQIPATRKRQDAPSPFGLGLIPIKQIDGRWIDPSLPLDPYFLFEVYGPLQLTKALSIFPLYKLKEASAKVEERNPGTKPKHRGQKAAIINYIAGALTSENHQ